MEKFPTGALYSKAQSLCTSFKGIFNLNSGTCFQLKINLHLTHVFSFSLCTDKSFACDHHAKEAQQVKNLPATWEILVQFLGQREDLLEKGMATHSSILAWRIPWTEEPSGLHRVAKSQTLPRKREKHIPRSVDPRVWIPAHSAGCCPSILSGIGIKTLQIKLLIWKTVKEI